MARFWPILVFIAVFVFVWLQPEKPQPVSNVPAISSPQRIISLAPSITETLFAIDAGDRVIAVTDYCQYPAKVKNLPKVGGYLDPNLEQIVRLQTDMVILLERQHALKKQLQQLGIQTLSIDNPFSKKLRGIRNPTCYWPLPTVQTLIIWIKCISLDNRIFTMTYCHLPVRKTSIKANS